jgi:hypothetical protein
MKAFFLLFDYLYFFLYRMAILPIAILFISHILFVNVTHAKYYQEGKCSTILILNKDMIFPLTKHL